MDKDEVQVAEFKSLLEELRKQLLDACIHFEIWEQLWPTEQVVDVINRYKGFFQPTRNAHIDRFYIKICNVVSNKLNQPSFYRVFNMLKANTTLAPGLDIRSLKKRLKSHKKTLSAIKQYRNTKGAHWDMVIPAKRKPVLFGDSKRMLEEMQNIYNEISGAATTREWSFKLSQHGDTHALLNHLNELGGIHKKRIDELNSRAKS